MIIYEYRTIKIYPNSGVNEYELNALGEQGFHIVAALDITDSEYDLEKEETRYVPGGTALIFEKEYNQ